MRNAAELTNQLPDLQALPRLYVMSHVRSLAIFSDTLEFLFFCPGSSVPQKMPRTKQQSCRCAKHRFPSRSSLLSLNLSPTQATATTSVGTTTDSTSATTSSVPTSTVSERKLCKSPHTPTLYSSSSSSSKSENESEYEVGGARVLEDWKWPGYRQLWRQFAARSVARGLFPLKICQGGTVSVLF